MRTSSKRKRKILLILFLVAGSALVIPFTRSILVIGEFCIWQVDLAREWELRVQVDVPPYSVELVQEPGADFYNSYLLIERDDGKTAFILMDADDRKWIKPQVVRQDGKTYFLRDAGLIGDRTPFVDPVNDIVFSGYYQRTFKISELAFETKQDNPDCTVMPLVDCEDASL